MSDLSKNPQATLTATSATKGNAKNAEMPLKPTDPYPDDNQRMAELREWAREKEYANDNWGGHKGVPSGEPNDPFKVFRWVGRKIMGKPTDGGRSHKYDTSPLRPGEIAQGDMDTHNLA